MEATLERLKAEEIAADVGGTFTDFVVRDEDGTVSTYKASTTPGNIANGIFDGLALIASRRGLTTTELVGQLKSFACGTTVATNAILEGKVEKTGLICTKGFRDTLLIREGGKDDTYDMFMDYPAPYIPRHLTFGVTERVTAEGEIVTALDEDEVRAAIRQMKEWGVEALAVSLLWSITNNAHELRIAEIVREDWPEVPLSLGHQVNPTIREYRRTSATALDASLKPVVKRNIHEVQTRLEAAGFTGVLTFVTSNGGRTSIEDVLEKPVYLCLSGPSAAPRAGLDVVKREGGTDGNIITTDMGGTSFDVSITTGWTTPMHREGSIGGEMFGVPSVEVLTIGAGGGSIARVDAGGLVHVGPESAGARPGPACYGRGGTLPTVTDANLVRGLLKPEGFADGQMTLDVAAAREAVRVHIAEPLGMSVEEAASLICMTAEQNMAGAIEDVTVRRGVDPRDFVLVSGGSAGGLHACPIAAELSMPQVVIPRVAGVLSAFGISVGDISFNFARPLFTSSARFDYAAVARVMGELKAEGEAYLDRMRIAPEQRELIFTAETRYSGQVWQLTLPLTGDIDSPEALAEVVESFHKLHEHFYAVRVETDPVEFTEFNLIAVGRSKSPVPNGIDWTDDGIAPEASETRKVYLQDAGGSITVPVYILDDLTPDHVVAGPALIQDTLTVTLIPARTKARATKEKSIVIQRGAHG